MAILNKIKDFFGIEHHEIHDTRIVLMKNGEYVVQEWNHRKIPCTPIYDTELSWVEATLLVDRQTLQYRSGRCFTLEEAKAFKKKFIENTLNTENRNKIDKVVE